MEHIDEKLTRLHQYHLIINDIAEALGYRMGQTYEPVELVRMVKELKEREQKLSTTVSFFSSVIKSGEPWSDTCQWRFDLAFNTAAEQEVLHDEGLARIGQRNAKLFKRSDEEVTDAN